MAEPIFSAKTERVWARLPEQTRADDAAAGWAFKTLLSTLTDRTDNVRTLVDRLTYLPRWSPYRASVAAGKNVTSDLVNPATADAGWLEWLAQIPGVKLRPQMTVQAKRDAIAAASTGWLAGTRPSIAAAAASALIGTRYVEVHEHSISAPGDGGRWDVLLITRSAETPDVPAVLAAVSAANAVPNGVLLHHRAFTSTWGQMEAAYGPAWATRNGKTWSQLQEAGL